MGDIVLRPNDGFTGGAGTELSALFHAVGIRPNENCGCRKMAQLMDLNGLAWCEANLDHIVQHIKSEAAKRNLAYLASFAARPTVHLAIARARAKGGCRP